MHSWVNSSDRLCLHSVLILAERAAVVDALVVGPGVGGDLARRVGVWTLEALVPVSATILK